MLATEIFESTFCPVCGCTPCNCTHIQIDEAKGLQKRVRVVKGTHAGKEGWIRQVKHGAFKGAPKSFYVDLDDGGQADNLPGSALRLVKEGLKDPKDNPCWKGYHPVGTKKKNGKTVPNCVPEGTEVVPATNPEDTVSLDIPLLIRLLEYSREDAKTDMDLHNVAERLITLSAGGRTLSMNDYDTIIPGSSD